MKWRTLRRALIALFCLCLVCFLSACVRSRRSSTLVLTANHISRKTLGLPSSPVLPGGDEEALQYIPEDVVATWREREYLVVLGVLSPDTVVRRRRRNLQRASCWTYAAVAKRSNNFAGELLALYFVARPHHNNYVYTPELKEEAVRWQDMITLPIREGVPGRDKQVGDGGSWGIDAEVTMSRKVFLWYDLIVRLLPRVNYIAKGDDDAFFHVPQYLLDLNRLPRQGLYWGNIWLNVLGDTYYVASGLLYTLSRDVAEMLVTYEPIWPLIRQPYNPDERESFSFYRMENEDIMVGRVLSLATEDGMIIATETCCRFHALDRRSCNTSLRGDSIVIHGVTEEGYGQMLARYSSDAQLTPMNFTRKRGRLLAKC